MDYLSHILSHWSEPELLTKYKDYLFLTVLVYSFIEVIFPPIPGDALLILSGSVTATVNIHPAWIIFFAFIGSFSGSLILYDLGYRMDRRILNSTKYSWLLDSKTFSRIDNGFKKYGFWIILFSRFLPVARSGIILAAGMVNMERRRSLIAVGISTVISGSILVLGGRFLGKRLQLILDFWRSQFRLIIIISAAIFLVYLLFNWLWKYYKRTKPEIDHE